MAYDTTNRMTDTAWREKDFDRLSDTPQLLGNQEALNADLARDHDMSDGTHDTQVVSDVVGYVSRPGNGDNPHPIDVGGVTFQLVYDSGPNDREGYLLRADVGADLAGIYEIELGFGGDREWMAFAVLTKLSGSEP